MKKIQKISAAFLSSTVLLAAFPLNAVQAAESGADAETDPILATIALNGTSASAEGENVTIDGTTVTITASGSYAISGTLDDGQIVVNVPDETKDPGTVKLLFNGVNVTSKSEAAVLIENAEKTSINIMDGTENTLKDGGLYKETNAVIYAKDDLTIKAGGDLGDGKLRIDSVYQNGIHCNNDVKITGGNIKIRTDEGDGTDATTGKGDGIRGKTSVEIKGGKIDINAGGDGVKSTKGTVTVSGGDTEIKAGNDAVQGETAVQISGGTLKANGDRGLTNANSGAAEGGPITITGGTILATATDKQVIVSGNTQNVLLFNTTTQQVKDRTISLYEMQKAETIFEMSPDKKYSYVLISSPLLTDAAKCTLSIGETQLLEGKPIELTGALTVLTDVVSDVPAAAPNYDINDNGAVDVVDAVLLARIVAGDSTLVVTDIAAERSDLDGDGKTGPLDLTQMLRHLARLI